MKKMSVTKILSILFILVYFISACNNNNKDEVLVKTDETIPGNFSDQTKKIFDSSALQIFLNSYPKMAVIAEDMRSFYNNKNYAYAWFDENGMIEQAGNLFNKIKNISDDGVDISKLLYQNEFNNLWENHSTNTKDSLATQTELMITAQYLLYAKQVWSGLDEEQSINLEWLLPRNKISYTGLLDSLLSGKDVLENAPVYLQYYLLKRFLKKYKISEAADTIIINQNFRRLKLGDSSAVIADTRYKLFLLGDLEQNTGSYYFDSSLRLAINNFQDRLGMKVSGFITKKEVEELNIPLKKRIEQLLVNMERCRWVPADLKNNYLLVNIPEYKLHAIENDSLLWDMKVVVGKSQSKTIVFNGNIKYVVFSPYWYLPYSIIKNEVLPGIKRNRNYLQNHNMEWNAGKVRQKPGPNNSLGLVKFLFPNIHSIYLHDSPAKSLYNETDRAFSHGCIRVSEPKKLAMYLLRSDSGWTSSKIDSAMNANKEKYVTLSRQIPVFIAYFTSWVDHKGKLNFRKDIYERDERLLKMLIN